MLSIPHNIIMDLNNVMVGGSWRTRKTNWITSTYLWWGRVWLVTWACQAPHKTTRGYEYKARVLGLHFLVFYTLVIWFSIFLLWWAWPLFRSLTKEQAGIVYGLFFFFVTNWKFNCKKGTKTQRCHLNENHRNPRGNQCTDLFHKYFSVEEPQVNYKVGCPDVG